MLVGYWVDALLSFCDYANLDDWWVNVNHVESYAKLFIAILLSRNCFSDCEHLNCFLIFSKKQCWDANCCRCGMDPSSCPLWLLLWTYWCLGLVQAGSVSSFKASRLVDTCCRYDVYTKVEKIEHHHDISWYRIYHDQPHTRCIQELLEMRIPFCLCILDTYACAASLLFYPHPHLHHEWTDMSPIGWSSQVNLLMLHTNDHPIT